MATGTHDETPTIVEWLPLDHLEPPATDVRNYRDRDKVRSIAESLERSGQIQPAKVVPVIDGDRVDDPDADRDALRALLDDAETFETVDGWTRREAARINNWERLRCEIWPTEPDDQVIESIEANTERLDMDDYETMASIKEWADENGLTHEAVGDRLGKSRSTISNWFRALDAPDFLLTAWQDPQTHIGYGHVREILQLPTDDLQQKVLRDALEYDRSVAMTRETAKNTLKGWKRRQRDDRTRDEKAADGTDKRAQRKAQSPPGSDDDARPCLLCGDRAEATVAVPVCKEDYGIMTRKKETEDPLLASLTDDQEAQTDADD